MSMGYGARRSLVVSARVYGTLGEAITDRVSDAVFRPSSRNRPSHPCAETGGTRTGSR
jgi:hypothetical protein